jgi:hypothetical protein
MPAQSHPAVHHLLRAAKHLHAAADGCAEAAGHHERGEDATAIEVLKGAVGHAGEAEAHVREAKRLQDRAESER